jgi:putative tryptophan/tyrosine transport system substrate-binding protein
MRRIGFLAPQTPNPLWIAAFRDTLREQKYLEGRNVVFELRSAEGDKGRYPRLIADLLAERPDVLATWSTPTSIALAHATSTIPIVSISGDPVGTGLAASLAHPTGNLTGFSILTGEIEAKQVQILKDIIPDLRSIAVLSNPSNPINQPVVDAIRRGGSRGYSDRRLASARRRRDDQGSSRSS